MYEHTIAIICVICVYDVFKFEPVLKWTYAGLYVFWTKLQKSHSQGTNGSQKVQEIMKKEIIMDLKEILSLCRPMISKVS